MKETWSRRVDCVDLCARIQEAVRAGFSKYFRLEFVHHSDAELLSWPFLDQGPARERGVGRTRSACWRASPGIGWRTGLGLQTFDKETRP
jgi:hypothetical protein